ncbi:MAG: peroxiredoxin [Polyangiaceae bacterium]|jgi:peroxiredoxin Q/BCP
MLKVGAPAPAFLAPSAGGPLVSMASLRGRIVVLYFFRKAFTRNCTVETKGFRDNYDELRALDAEVVGVSTDDVSTQCKFASELGVKFPMIADRDRAISRAYDVFFLLLPVVHRVTYVVDRRGIVAGVFNHEFQVVRHLDEVLHFVRELASRAPG